MKKAKKTTKKKGSMDESCNMSCSCCSSSSCSGKGCGKGSKGSCSIGLYCLGFIGSVIYYISTATSFWTGFVGVLKSLVWPAFIVFEAMKFLGM